MSAIQELIEDFQLLDNWDDKYAHIIAMGGQLPPLPEQYRTDEYKIYGCMAQVWLHCRLDDGRLTILADSDAAIVKGLIAILCTIFDGMPGGQLAETNVEEIFHALGLDSHITPNRRNGFFAMVAKIKGFQP